MARRRRQKIQSKRNRSNLTHKSRMQTNTKIHSGRDSGTYITQGMRFLYDDKLELAIEYFEKAIIANPEDARSYSCIGAALEHLGRPGEAINHFKRAIKLDSQNADLHAEMGAVFWDLGKHRDVIDCFNRAVELNPTNLSVRSSMGMALFMSGRHKEA
ncbi:MAG: tetratricopeptide repeat protein, partial [Cenarchaeum sp. SB0669_bin_11]|nr:tetratricopeptide repeat protein [Cenarchaeum sp. SB0669_bin_11]